MNIVLLKKNWYLLTPVAIVVVPMLMIAYCMVSYGYELPEAMKAVRHFGVTSTRYGQGFSERKFKMVRVGMDGNAVFNTLKVPMERNVPEDTEWRYSLPASGARYYHERTLIMAQDKNGVPRVKQRISRFHTPD
jgi:hypothetical protein